MLAYILYFILPSFCQLNTFAETIPIVSIKYSPLSEIIRHVLIDEKSKSYYSDTLNFMVRYGDTIFQRDISMDSNPTYYINAGTPVYMFVITPCPEGIPTIDDNSFYLLKYNNHYFYLMNYNGNKCDSSLFSYPGESIDRNLILQNYLDALFMSQPPAISPTILGSHTAIIGGTVPPWAMAPAIVIRL